MLLETDPWTRLLLVQLNRHLAKCTKMSILSFGLAASPCNMELASVVLVSTMDYGTFEILVNANYDF